MGQAIQKLVFQPPAVSYINSKKEIHWIPCGETQIPMIFMNRQSPYTVIFSHGNAEDLGMCFEWFNRVSRRMGINIVCYDYEGYGLAKGTPSEQKCYDAIDAVYDYVLRTFEVDPSKVILWGRSLGSGPSTYLAERLSLERLTLPAGVVLQSPPASIFRVAFNFRFTLPWDLFPNVDRMPNIACPVWLIHGTKDELVPFSCGEALFFATLPLLRHKPLWVTGGGHNNLELLFEANGKDIFTPALVDFLKRVTDGMYTPPEELINEGKAAHKAKKKGWFFSRAKT
jgi:fermentation-respiration switch protein FrsA (DUF1100 family)